MSCGRPCQCESYRTHLLSVGFAAATMPTRNPQVADTERRERVLAKDLDAYKRLRRDGLQPPDYRGAAFREATATTEAQVEGRPV